MFLICQLADIERIVKNFSILKQCILFNLDLILLIWLTAALEILNLIGFNEDVVSDEIGKAETYLVLKQNDPGLLWLAKSSLETCIA